MHLCATFFPRPSWNLLHGQIISSYTNHKTLRLTAQENTSRHLLAISAFDLLLVLGDQCRCSWPTRLSFRFAKASSMVAGEAQPDRERVRKPNTKGDLAFGFAIVDDSASCLASARRSSRSESIVAFTRKSTNRLFPSTNCHDY